MITHKEAAVAHVSTAINAAVTRQEPSIAQAVDQARMDTSNQPSWQQSLVESTLPDTGKFHSGQQTVNAHGADDPGQGGSDPSKRGDNAAASLDDFASAVNALRSSMLDDFDPTKNHDPSKKSDVLDSTLPSGADLQAQLGLPGSSNKTDPTDPSASHGSPGRPEPGSTDPAANPDAHHSALEGMLSDDGKTGRDAVQKEIEKGTFGKQVPDIVGGNSTTPTGQAAQDAKLEDDMASGRVNRESHSSGGVTSDKYTDNQGHLIKTVVTDKNNGTTTTLNADGSTSTTKTDSKGQTTTTTTPAPSIPDEDHQTSVDPAFTKLMQDAIKSEHPPSHENDNKHVVDSDIPGTVSASDVKSGAVVDVKTTLLGGDRIGGDGLSDTGHGGGMPGADPNKPTLDFGGPDYTPTPQSNGPEERSPQPAVKTNPGVAHSGGQESGGSKGGEQNSGDSHQLSPVSTPVETTAQRLAHELQDAYRSSHPDGSTKTAQSVEATHTGHDTASVLGGSVGSAVGGHDNGAFGDLIRLAQNPAQSGLVPPPVPAGHDAIAALQLSALGDLAGHAVDAHHVDDVHAAALALPAAVHEDVSHVTAAVIDHGHH